MKKLLISISNSRKEIPIIFNSPIWENVGNFIEKSFQKHSKFLITDENIFKIYRKTIENFLTNLNNFKKILVVPAGERSKSREQRDRLEDEILDLQGGRDSVLILLGGGVVGDLGGLVAATLHRGIPYVQIPTTILAQVDSSIGGKVGINHPRGKNLIGAFYHPKSIFVDVAFLKTLPEEEFINGLAEVIKYAVTLDDTLWKILEEKEREIFNRDVTILKEIIYRSIQAKIHVVEKDEKESSYRSLLNFGHTVGHAIENLSHFHIKHGFAIAAGMRVAVRISHRLFGYPESQVLRLEKLLKKYHLNTVNLSAWSFDEIWHVMTIDKKARESHPRFTLLDAEGQPVLFHSVSKREFVDAYEATK